MKTYQPIPNIANFTNKDGSDILKETIEANNKRVKADVFALVDLKIDRVKTMPELAYLIKE